VGVALGEPGELGRIKAASMQVRMANRRAGGIGSSDLSPKSSA
jgi:hypothetical protein